ISLSIAAFWIAMALLRSNAFRRYMARRNVVQDAAFEPSDRKIGDDADEGQQDDGDEHHRRVGGALAIGQKIAKAGIAADELADDDADDGKRRTDAQPREERGHGRAEFDLPKHLEPRRGEGAREIDEIVIDGAERRQHIDHDRKEDDQYRD